MRYRVVSLSLNKLRPLNSELFAKDKSNEMIDFIEKPMEGKNMVGDLPITTPEDDELADLVRCIVRAADGRKAENIVALRVSTVSTLTTFVVISSGNSRPQNQAIAAAIKDDVSNDFDLLPGSTGVPEGSAESGWMVLDYGGVICHVMTPKSRLYYNIEGQWENKGGEQMDLSDVIIPNTIDQTSGVSPAEGIEEDDPFWS
ncbi:unnamed protein product [Cylindrotheca closterium]|uniref:Ribosome silencing factor n=1 Tax=Cylindrotheca closterium TaxID=2856 RepID=A0AAD2G045_9STRA|nr:unnamed protein product [Cylindrotheca closterium]